MRLLQSIMDCHSLEKWFYVSLECNQDIRLKNVNGDFKLITYQTILEYLE